MSEISGIDVRGSLTDATRTIIPRTAQLKRNQSV